MTDEQQESQQPEGEPGTWGEREGHTWGEFEPPSNEAVAGRVEDAMGLPAIPTEHHSADQLKGNVTSLVDELTEMLTAGVQRYSQDERARIGVGLTVQPTPQGPMAGYTLVLQTPGMLLGTWITIATMIPAFEDAPWTQEYADDIARQLWEAARQSRSDQPQRLQRQQQEAEQQMAAVARQAAAAQNGQPPAGPGGLFIPGN